MGYTAFLIFLSVYVICETHMYIKGHDTFFFEHKTQEERRIREAIIVDLESKSKKE